MNLEQLNTTLFQTLNDLKSKKIDEKKANAIVNISNAIIKNTSVQLTAFKMMKGQIKAPKSITNKEVFATLGTGDTYDQKTEFAKKLGFKSVSDAIDEFGLKPFNEKFKNEFPA